MPVTITCSHCRKQLRVQETHLGRQVRCPACQQAFTAATPSPEPAEEEVPDVSVFEVPEERPARSPRPAARHDDEDEGSLDFESRPKGKSRTDDEEDGPKPHRGTLVFVLGLLGFILSGCPLAGWILGGLAMSMGGKDTYEMAFGRMDRSGQGMTKAGRILGIVGVVISSISGLVLFVRVVMFVMRLLHVIR